MLIKYKIIKKLGSGFNGTSFLVKDKLNNKYVLKQSTLPTKITKKRKKEIETVVKFSNEMYKLNQNHFSKLYQHKIHRDCKIIKKTQNVTVFGNNEKNFKNEQKSKNCVKYLFDFKEHMFEDVKINKHNWNSFITQMIYIIYLMKKKKWTQNDLNLGNVAYNKTNLKTIKIKINKNEYEVKTFGKIYSLIDYDNVLQNNRATRDMINFIYHISSFGNFYIVSSWMAFDLKIKNFTNKIFKKLKTDDLFLYYMNNREKLRKVILEITNNKIDPNKNINTTINLKKHKKDILYLYNNIDDNEKLIKYFNK